MQPASRFFVPLKKNQMSLADGSCVLRLTSFCERVVSKARYCWTSSLVSSVQYRALFVKRQNVTESNCGQRSIKWQLHVLCKCTALDWLFKAGNKHHKRHLDMKLWNEQRNMIRNESLIQQQFLEGDQPHEFAAVFSVLASRSIRFENDSCFVQAVLLSTRLRVGC